MPLSDMSVLLSVNKIHTTENKDLCGSEQSYLKPKRDDSHVRYLG